MKKIRDDLSGQVFGKLTVRGPARHPISGKALWNCLCDCGNSRLYESHELLKRGYKSCGCEKSNRLKRTDAMKKAANLVGMKFGKLVVMQKSTTKGGRAYWICKCECGNIAETTTDKLKSGHTKSCGCQRALTRVKHGHSLRSRDSLTYKVWSAMKGRCNNPNDKKFADYGGRGIRVCDRWKSFENFLEDMGEAPDGMSIDRVDNNGHYSPENCRWATQKEQARNTRRNIFLTINGETLCAMEWSEKLSKPYFRIRYLIRKYGNRSELVLAELA